MVLIIIGNLVLLNLFLAILINNFMTNRKKEQTLSETVLVYSLSRLKNSCCCRKTLHKDQKIYPEDPSKHLNISKLELSMINRPPPE